MGKKSLLVSLSILVFLFGLTACDSKKPPHPRGKRNSIQRNHRCHGKPPDRRFRLAQDQAYPALLQKKLLADGHNYKVVNAGVSGETSSGALSRVKWILGLKPDIVILETGANDGFRGINPVLTEKNIDETVRILQENQVTVVLAGMQIVRNLGKEYSAAFKEIYPRIAQRREVIFIPFFLQGVAGEKELNQSDTIHPTAEGYEIIVKTLYPYVLEAIQKRKQEQKG
jgi:acyl-CoA thioesterase-1